MVDLVKCKFGDKLRTRGGSIAIYIGRDDIIGFHALAVNRKIQGNLHPIIYCPDNGKQTTCNNSKYDIIGRWEDENEKTQVHQ